MQPMANIALRAARSAAQVITRALDRPDLVKIEKRTQLDVITNVHRQAEKIIIDALQDTYPEHGILGKVSGLLEGKGDARQPSKSKDEYLWLIDPLDGGFNLVRGIPHFAISIACQRSGKTEHAVVVNPVLNEEFTASRGQGARVNDLRIRVSGQDSMAGALIGTNDSDLDILIPKIQQLSGAIAAAGGSVRNSGCTSLELSYVAAGRLDGAWLTGLNEMNMLAGCLLIQEAGGLISDFQGGQGFVTSGNLATAGAKLFKPFLQLVRKNLVVN